MEKSDAVASLGQTSLLQPTRVRAALRANDRLKLYLTVLQAAAAQAAQPAQAALDLSREIAAAGVAGSDEADWLHDLPATARLQGQGRTVHLPDLPRLAQGLHDDLLTMARPLLDDASERDAFAPRVQHWAQRLVAIDGPALDAELLDALTHGRRSPGAPVPGRHAADSLHLTVMDLHKALNRLAARLAAEAVDGAHVWGLAADGSDQPRVAAFMRGLNRTRGLKLDHPGLDTAATRDGELLLIQNDIGTNDAHVLVLQVRGLRITLTYSDLHRQRFGFFQQLLGEVGAQWGDVHAQTTAGLNQGEAYYLGTATFDADDEAGLQQRLEGIGARIVFLIDWNRARKRLLAFVDGAGAVAVLREAARRECGHMAWLQAGGERLVWNAMSAQGEGQFRLGDRLDDVLGEDAAQALLVDLLALAWQAAQRQQPVALVADEARWLLARRLQGRLGQMDLLEEHAALCHALAQGVRDGLAHGVHRDAHAAAQLTARAKAWERQADHLVMRARTLAERQPQWQPLARLLERSDDVADALEEAAFVLGMVADGHHQGWSGPVLAELQALAGAVLGATQDHVKALAVVRSLGQPGARAGGGNGHDGHDGGEAADRDEFLAASWRVLNAERQCDTLLRSTRRVLAREVHDAASLLLGNELAAALEQASDALLALAYGLREQAFQRAGVPA